MKHKLERHLLFKRIIECISFTRVRFAVITAVLLVTGCVSEPAGKSGSDDAKGRASGKLSQCDANEVKLMERVKALTWTIEKIFKPDHGHYIIGDKFTFKFCNSGFPNTVDFDSTRHPRGPVEYELTSEPIISRNPADKIVSVQFCFKHSFSSEEHLALFHFGSEQVGPRFVYEIEELDGLPCPTKLPLRGKINYDAHGHGTGTGR